MTSWRVHRCLWCHHLTSLGQTTESVHCTITGPGPCLRMFHRPSRDVTCRFETFTHLCCCLLRYVLSVPVDVLVTYVARLGSIATTTAMCYQPTASIFRNLYFVVFTSGWRIWTLSHLTIMFPDGSTPMQCRDRCFITTELLLHFCRMTAKQSACIAVYYRGM